MSGDLGERRSGQVRNDDQFAQLEGGEDDLLPGARQVVLVSVPNLLDEATHVQAFEQVRQLGTGVLRQNPPQARVAEAADLPFAARQGGEEGQVVGFSPLTFVGTVMVMRGSAN